MSNHVNNILEVQDNVWKNISFLKDTLRGNEYARHFNATSALVAMAELIMFRIDSERENLSNEYLRGMQDCFFNLHYHATLENGVGIPYDKFEEFRKNRSEILGHMHYFLIRKRED